ncbi:DsbA family protein [Brevundimonas sp.]|uniref:DsbA family protein n=1 Tax=Brevundimonas sp. TaxID=1871086 RepID=UPI002EDA98F8
MSDLRVPINDQDHVFGPADAPVTLVEYGDYQCPHCQAAWPEVERVLRHFGRGLGYVYRHFPLWTVHPMAKPAAEAAEFAGAHGRFWDMHAAIFANGHLLSGAGLFMLARQQGLDAAELRLALEQGVYTARVDADLIGGARSGVNGTPCFFVNGQRHNGPHDAMSLSAAIDAATLKAGGAL